MINEYRERRFGTRRVVSLSRAVFLPVTLFLAGWLAPAAALDRAGAIEAAKRHMKSNCTSGTVCTYTPRAEKDKWYVRVEYPGGHAILIFNQTGKVIGRIEGK